MRVLIVEDHKELALTIAGGLRREGMAVDAVFDGQEGLRHGMQDSYDVVVLDRDLPGLHGDEVCRALVAAGTRARVLMLTAADTIESRVDGLGLGADDYLPKPFAFAELVARIRALERRSHPARPPLLACGDIQLDTIHRVATRAGRRIELSPKELTVLELLLAAGGAPLSTEELLQRGWDQYADAFSGVVKVTINRLRAQARRARRDRDGPPRRLPHTETMTTRPIAALSRRWQSLPPRTIRLRLTVIYGGLFIVCGAALLGITYGLVSNRYTPGYVLAVGQQAGVKAGFGPPLLSGTPQAPLPLSIPDSAKLLVRGPTGLPRPASGQVAARAIVTASKAQSTAALGTLLAESAIALTIMAVIALWLAWVVAGRALRPLRTMTATARAISASNLHRRLALDGPDDELAQLADTFDALLERLETAFAAQRQFAANVSHELRTPLTLERTLLEVALADPEASADSLRGVCEKLLANGHHQERLIEALLVMSRSQRGLERREVVDLARVAAQALAGIDSGDLAVEKALQPAITSGDPPLVERLAANLVGNAVRHNRPGGRLSVTTRTVAGRAILTVTNTGPELCPDDLDRLFEPFQRLDGARTSRGDGLGLGLSIVKAIADAHAATISTRLPADGGLSVEVGFPSAPPSEAIVSVPQPPTTRLPAPATR